MSDTGADYSGLEVSLGFTGNYPLRMDSAQRVPIPARFKEVLEKTYVAAANQVVLMPDSGKVKILPVPVWQNVKKQLESLPSLDPKSNQLRTYVFGNLAICGLDAQNRIRLTPGLCELARLQKEVVVVGQQDCMEIWDAVMWKEFTAATAENLSSLYSEVFNTQRATSGS
jgi:MraZ protein